MSSIPISCNFCKEEVLVNTVHVNPNHVIWCNDCVRKQANQLDRAGVQYDLGVAGYNVWGRPENVAKLYDLMNSKVELGQVKIEEPTVITSVVCPKFYYGIGSCVCNNCRISKKEASGAVTDPFGYKHSGQDDID